MTLGRRAGRGRTREVAKIEAATMQRGSLRYTGCDTKVGKVWAAWSERGIACLGLDDESEEDFVRRVRRYTRIVPQRDDGPQPTLERVLADWFAGSDPMIELDLTYMTPFQRTVLGYVRRIPRGRVETYGSIARGIGRPGAARAVGTALSRNPIPLLIPCHRVVAADGGLGGFSAGGPTRKAELLRWEGVEFEDGGPPQGR